MNRWAFPLLASIRSGFILSAQSAKKIENEEE